MGSPADPEPTDAAGPLPAGPGPIRLRVDRHTHPDPADRARAWRAAMSVSMETVFEPGDLDGFEGSASVHPIGPFLVVDLSLAPATLLRGPRTRAAWKHDHVIVDCVVSGSIRGRIGGRPVNARAGDCLMVDLKGGMHVRLDGTRFVGLIMPRPLFREVAGKAVAVDGVVFEAASPQGQVLGPLLTALVAQVDRLPAPAALALARAVVGVTAACVAPGTSARDGEAHGWSAAAPTLAQVRRFIDRQAARPEFDAGAVCAQFGLSRTALYRMFALVGGVAALIRRRRAALAVRLLTQPGASTLTTAAVARASGFGTERSLRNALRQLYAASPRAIMRDGAPLVAEDDPDPSAAEIGRLFDEL